MTRQEIANELLRNCPAECLEDHEVIAQAILDGKGKDAILDMPETDRWPETWSWLNCELAEDAQFQEAV